MLLHLIHSIKDTNQCFRLWRCGQFGKLASFIFVFSRRRRQSMLHALNDGIWCRIISMSIFGHHLFDLIPNHLPSDGCVFQRPIEPTLWLAFGFELSGCQVGGALNGNLFDRLRCDDDVDESHLPCLVRSDVLAGEHHVHGILQADERVQILGATKSWQQAQLDLRQTQLDLLGIGADAVVAPQRPFQAASERGAVDAAHQRDLLGLHVLEEGHVVFDEADQVLLVLDGLQVKDVGTRDEHVALGGKEDDGFDVCVGVDVGRPQLSGLVGEREADGVDGLAWAIEADDGNAVCRHFDILKEFVLAFRRRLEWSGGSGNLRRRHCCG
mmetsp:Transcript_10183/g.29024  ORF Transcript_10183/g.29024 Transcript_10183/m.29024 type:complete len:326 (-) Transcript_10183:436-1413(-)